MGTTKLSVEFVISGVIIVLAIFFLAGSVFPIFDGSIAFIDLLNMDFRKLVLLAIVTTSVCYGFGIVFEYLGLITFEWLLDRVKENEWKGLFHLAQFLYKKVYYC